MNQRIEYDIATKCGKIRHNCSFLRDKIIIFIQIRSSKVARNCEVGVLSFSEEHHSFYYKVVKQLKAWMYSWMKM